MHNLLKAIQSFIQICLLWLHCTYTYSWCHIRYLGIISGYRPVYQLLLSHWISGLFPSFWARHVALVLGVTCTCVSVDTICQPSVVNKQYYKCTSIHLPHPQLVAYVLWLYGQTLVSLEPWKWTVTTMVIQVLFTTRMLVGRFSENLRKRKRERERERKRKRQRTFLIV